MGFQALVASVVHSWTVFYDEHQMVSVTVRFVHLASLMVGGGAAIAADWRILRAGRSQSSDRQAAVLGLGAIHRVVVPALAFVIASGTLMTLSDTATFLSSRVYWTKMGLVTLLLANGALLVSAESKARRSGGPQGWGVLRLASAASLTLWLVIVYVGLWLTVAA
jgi:hypothetical protein